MKQLILVRHAKTERHAPSGEDFDRRLTPQGCEDARRMGVVLKEAGFKPDLVLVSEAARARQTWDLAKSEFPAAVAETRPQLYLADAGEILRLAQRCAPTTVMVVAHNPAIHALTAALAGQGDDPRLEARVRDGFPTAAVAVFDLDGDTVKALAVLMPGDPDGAGVYD